MDPVDRAAPSGSSSSSSGGSSSEYDEAKRSSLDTPQRQQEEEEEQQQQQQQQQQQSEYAHSNLLASASAAQSNAALSQPSDSNWPAGNMQSAGAQQYAAGNLEDAFPPPSAAANDNGIATMHHDLLRSSYGRGMEAMPMSHHQQQQQQQQQMQAFLGSSIYQNHLLRNVGMGNNSHPLPPQTRGGAPLSLHGGWHQQYSNRYPALSNPFHHQFQQQDHYSGMMGGWGLPGGFPPGQDPAVTSSLFLSSSPQGQGQYQVPAHQAPQMASDPGRGERPLSHHEESEEPETAAPPAASKPSNNESPPQEVIPLTSSLGPDVVFLAKKRRAYRHESFPEKLYRMLEEIEKDGKDHIISFSSSGMAIEIHRTDLLTEEIIPKYFRHKRLSSFRRQLSMYGLKRVKEGAEKGAYQHELFIRGRPDLLRQIKRVAELDMVLPPGTGRPEEEN